MILGLNKEYFTEFSSLKEVTHTASAIKPNYQQIVSL